jgi:hypothetical protein
VGNQQPSLMSNHLEGSTTRVSYKLDQLPFDDRIFLKSCIFGDGWLGLQRRRYVHLRIGHSEKQHEWLKYKAERINKILSKDRKILGPYTQKDGSGSGKEHISYLYCIDDHALFKPWFDRWYEIPQNGKVVKHITEDFVSDLGLRELAVLWCDDGSITSSERYKKHRLKNGDVRLYPYVESAGSIALCSLSDAELFTVQKWILNLTGIKFNITKRKAANRTTLIIHKNALRQFIPLIAPFVPSCMSYKIDLSHCRIKHGKSPTSAEHPNRYCCG